MMPPFKVAPCTLEDVPAIARNNVTAFWEDIHWALQWTRKNKSCEYVISQAEFRWSYNLTKDPVHIRREKAVDVSTGELVGFSSWYLPEDEDWLGKQEKYELWPEARVPEVDDEKQQSFKKRFDEADWESDRVTDVLDSPVTEMRIKLKGDKKWLRKYFRSISYTFLQLSNCTYVSYYSPWLSCSSSQSPKTRSWLALD
jgi:hypothetical protein